LTLSRIRVIIINIRDRERPTKDLSTQSPNYKGAMMTNSTLTPNAANLELNKAILFLAQVCDGANSRDYQGFAGCDTTKGHKLAELIVKSGNIPPAYLEWAKKTVIKYSKQLTRIGVDVKLCQDAVKVFSKPIVKTKPTIIQMELGVYDNGNKKLLCVVYDDGSVKTYKLHELLEEKVQFLRQVWKHQKTKGVPCTVV